MQQEERVLGESVSEEKCDQCDEPSEAFIRFGRKRVAQFCYEHNRNFTKANVARRGRILVTVARARKARKS